MSCSRQHRSQRSEARRKHGALFDQVTGLLFRHDPVGINYDFNVDEYDVEAASILDRLPSCGSAGAAQLVVHEEFVRWFGPQIAGPSENYATVSHVLWNLWRAVPSSARLPDAGPA